MNDADIETLELIAASRWAFCAKCGDEVKRATLDVDGICAQDHCKNEREVAWLKSRGRL